MSLLILSNAAVRMTLVCAVIWLAIRVLRLRNPHGELLAWRLVLVVSLALPAALYFRMAPSVVTPLQLPVLTVNGAGLPGAPSGTHGQFWRVLEAIYLGGALLLFARLATGLAFLSRICRAAVPLPMPDDVRMSRYVSSPATFGSVVLLPAGTEAWPAGKLEAILAHERAHVRSRDSYWSWLAHLNCALFWFSPHAWWLKRQLASLAETLGDDAVLAARHDPFTYAELLLDFARHPNNRSVAMSIAESHVSKRIERLLARIPPAKALPRAARWFAVALLVPAVMLVATTTHAAPTPESARVADEGRVGILTPAMAADYYPAIAMAEHVEGSAVLEADLDALGQLVDARVLSVEPADARFGFADAALQVARNTTYVNTRQQPASFQFKVKFALDDN